MLPSCHLSLSFHGSPRCQLSWTAEKQCCAVVVWAPSCAVGVLLLKFNLYSPVPLTITTTTHLPHTHTHTHSAHVIITVVSPQLAHIHTPLTWQWIVKSPPDWTGPCYRMWLGIGACNRFWHIINIHIKALTYTGFFFSSVPTWILETKRKKRNISQAADKTPSSFSILSPSWACLIG